MTKAQIIEKTLAEVSARTTGSGIPSWVRARWVGAVRAELESTIPEGEIKTCEDFGFLHITCCHSCHGHAPDSGMTLIKLPRGTAWVCCEVGYAIQGDAGAGEESLVASAR